MANDLTTLTARLSERVGNNTVYFVAAEKTDALNEAISVWGALTGEFTSSGAVVVVNGDIYYTTPDPITTIQRVRLSTTPLLLTSLAELDAGYPGWEDEAASTPRFWAPVGIGQFAIYPAATSGTLTCEGQREVPWLVNGGDLIDLGEEEIVHILSYAHHVLSFKEGGAEFQSTMPALKAFFEAAALRNQRLRSSAFYRKFMGEHRDPMLRPDALPPPTVGTRT